ncbi:hypothetical protein INT48_005531 [Thamnidium elegans]|uniref:Methionyl-tRNA formyltransferase, mitochondrial n=1 Tax=Thamnidium elegans TaxID=101142 RepID=A0A8H7SZT1_9FUNG|nr:hypothetical protein INT48_005531 [Thamnidium elegans]
MFKLLKPNVFIARARFYTTKTTNDNKLRVLFFGTDDFASTHLKALLKEKERVGSCITSIDLVCPPDRKTGRKLENLKPSDTKTVAESNRLEIFHTPHSAKDLTSWNLPTDKPYDVGVVVSFGYFIPPHIISSFKYGAVNVHPSLLPKYRGAAPIQHAIMYGDSETGVTVQELDDREFDAGRILAQEKVSLMNKLPVYSELKKELSILGSKLLVDTLCNLENCKNNATIQDVSKATKAPKVKKEWSEVDFVNMSAWQADQLSRAIGEQYPLRTYFKTSSKKPKDITVQLLHLYLPERSYSLGLGDSPGSFAWDESTKSIHMVFGDGSIVACPLLKPENKAIMTAKDFINGYQVQGKFGVSLETDDSLIERNIKKRSKMHRFELQ